MTLDDLKKTDVWSMSMLFFLLINPDKKYPYEEEIRDLTKSGMTATEKMKSVFTNFKLPLQGDKYAKLRIDGHWSNIEKAYIFSAKLKRRPTIFEVQSLLKETHGVEKRGTGNAIKNTATVDRSVRIIYIY